MDDMNKTKLILVVEDEAPIARTLELKLKKALFDVEVACDGEQALASLAHKAFHLILLDLIMPKMDGFAVLEALQKQKCRIPIIVLTNLGQEDDRKRATALGAKDYFIKSDTSLRDIVEQIKCLFP